jgi:excisionase family DNA binding protein
MADDIEINRNRTYSVGTAARLLGLSASTVRNLERRGQLEAIRTPGGQRRFLGAELIRVREESISVSTKKPPTVSTATADADAQLRHVWLGSWVARAQRELAADAPADTRLRVAADLERVLRPFGPASLVGDVERLVKSMIDRAQHQTEEAREADERREMKGQLLEHALAHLRRSIDALRTRVAGAARSFERRHIHAILRDHLQSLLAKRFTGDEDWEQARELADEVLAAWYVEQSPASRIPTTAKLLAAGVTGVVGGAATAAALDPRIRAAAVNLKEPLRSLAVNVLNHFSPPASSTTPSADSQDQGTTPPPPHPPTGSAGPRPSYYRRTSSYRRFVTRTRTGAGPARFRAGDSPATQGAPTASDVASQGDASTPVPPS